MGGGEYLGMVGKAGRFKDDWRTGWVKERDRTEQRMNQQRTVGPMQCDGRIDATGWQKLLTQFYRVLQSPRQGAARKHQKKLIPIWLIEGWFTNCRFSTFLSMTFTLHQVLPNAILSVNWPQGSLATSCLLSRSKIPLEFKVKLRQADGQTERHSFRLAWHFL